MPAEFDRYAAGGYSKILLDPIRGRFAGAEFYFRRKLILLKEFCRQRGIETEKADWLDVGCGDGGLLRMGEPYFRSVAGCDVSEGMLQECAGLNVKHQDSPQRVPFEDASFDVVTMVCVYHHVELVDRPALTADVSRVLKPGGLLCIIEHNPFNPVTRLIVWRHPVDAHAQLLRASRLRRLAQDAQLEILATRYFLFFPERFYSALAATETKLSSVPLGGQYAVFCRKR